MRDIGGDGFGVGEVLHYSGLLDSQSLSGCRLSLDLLLRLYRFLVSEALCVEVSSFFGYTAGPTSTAAAVGASANEILV